MPTLWGDLWGFDIFNTLMAGLVKPETNEVLNAEQPKAKKDIITNTSD